ncbi:uncharacterized protein TNCT_450721 [Trichonephila clavata]|uniref:Uncharacterized protein n=1 Tax=Trichonephila clavata TaxID=2740835 RepID=A0A8X6F4Z8_TRICU|nr:uncharacterized protein TNCT_450721 [Trichonephila clavata]
MYDVAESIYTLRSVTKRLLKENIYEVYDILRQWQKEGYACCAFLRCEEEDEVKVSLVSAKARVATVQRQTILRLELLGAAIGARIASTILETLNSPLKTYFWTDSMTVLGWITNSEPWNTFVGNRVREIRELTNVEDWRFVPGDLNPADLPSRSCDWSQLFRSQWWEGPNGLTKVQNVGHTLRHFV